MDEKDLFGSDSEEDVAAAPAPAAAAPAGSPPATTVAQTAEDKGLFGSDEEDIMSEKDLFGTDDEADGVDEKDLFGSDDEAAPGVPAAQEGVPQPPSRAESVATAEPSEMDEEDIFGRDLSDDEEGVDMKKEVEDVVLRKRPMPNAGREFAALRMPNILTAEKKPFNPLKFSEEVRNGCMEKTNTQAKKTVKLLGAENVIRWRFKKSEEGQLLTSDDGRPQYESNARIVEWDDGSRTLFVGKEAFPLSSIPDHVALFEENTQEVSVCHGFIKHRLVATPRSLGSETHEHIKRAQFHKFEPNSRSLLMNTDDQAYLKDQQELERDLAREKEKRDRKLLKIGAGESSMNAAFLESDSDADGGVGPSVKKPKH
jgi:RNA polymerase-associated protein LEO1